MACKDVNFDPNRVYCGRKVKQKVELEFGYDLNYRKTITIEVGGNCRGLDVIDQAINNLEGELILTNIENGNTLDVSSDDDDADEIKKYLIRAEIISMEDVKKK